MKHLIIAVLLSVSIPLVAQNKHINFDNTGKIETNLYTKVDTILLINKNRGIITDTVFTVSLDGIPAFHVSKNNPQAHSFFPFKSVQIVKKKDDAETKSTSLFVFDIMGFFCFALVFFCLIVSLGMINRKYLKSVRSAFSEVNASFIATKTQLATLEHRVSKIKDYSDELATIIGRIDYLDRKLKDYSTEEKELINEAINLNKEALFQPIRLLDEVMPADDDELTEGEIAHLDEKLSAYSFPNRILTVFAENEILTIRDLLKFTVGGRIRNLLYLRFIGTKGRREILDILGMHNFIDPVPVDAPSDFTVTSKYSRYLNTTK